MIVEMVRFDRPEGFSDNDLMEDARSTVAHWRANPELIRKQFLAGEDGTVIGLYLWPDRAAAKRAHDAAWVERFRARTGVEPRFAYFDLFMMIDNAAGEVTDFPLGDRRGEICLGADVEVIPTPGFWGRASPDRGGGRAIPGGAQSAP